MTIAQLIAAYVKPDGVGIEVGVGEGDTSLVLLNVAKPKVFHYLDCWAHQEHAIYPDDFNVSQSAQNKRMDLAVARIQKAAGKVETHGHRLMSLVGAGALRDHKFDWIYLDANHSYEATKADLNAWWPMLKKGGTLFVHDYCREVAYFGVVEAVDEFVSSRDDAMQGMTSEEKFPATTIVKG